MLSLTTVLEMTVSSDFELNDDTVTPGFLGFGVFLAIAAVTFLLLRSMTRRIKKIEAPSEADLVQREWEEAESRKVASGKAGKKAGKAGKASGPEPAEDA